MTDRIGVTKSSPSTSFWLEADVLSYNPGGGYVTIRCYLRAANGPSGNSSSQFNNIGYQIGYSPNGEFGRHTGNPFLPSGYAQNQQRWRDGPWDVNVAMSGPRNIALTMQLVYGNINESYNGSVYSPWVPAKPTPVTVDQITGSSMRYVFSGGSDGGSAIIEWQSQIATNSAFTTGLATIQHPTSGYHTYGSLAKNTVYYFRSRGRNGVGWGPWSSVTSARTLNTPGAPNPIAIDQITPVSLRYRFQGTTDGGSPITGWQAQIATDPAFTQGVQTWGSNGATTFTGLVPATTYYLRSRGINAVGYGPWSLVISGMTYSGAYVSLSGRWVAVPLYVSDGTGWDVPELLISNGTAWEAAV